MFYLTKIGQFCAEHDDWEDTLTNIPYSLKVKRDGDYVIFNYDQIKSDFNREIVREARGIIFREGKWEKPVCHAFDKFGNYGESYVPEIDWDTAVVTEKIDGSLIKIWYDEGWRISTNGTINAFKAELNNVKFQTYGDLLMECLNVNLTGALFDFLRTLDKGSTHMFELVSPYNRVVIPYKETKLYFLGLRNEDGIVKPFHQCSEMVTMMRAYGIDTPKVYHLGSLEQCIEATKELPWDEEGYVVDDMFGERVKIKSPAYVVAHHARNNGVITKAALIDIVLANEVEEFLTYAEEYRDEIEQIKEEISTFKKDSIRWSLKIMFKGYSNRKEYAEEVKKCPRAMQPYLFKNYGASFPFSEYIKDWDGKKWERMLDSYESFNSSRHAE